MDIDEFFSEFLFSKLLQVENKRIGSSDYLSLPSTRQELELRGVGGSGSSSKLQILSGPLTLLPKDSFQISTLFVSTKLTNSGECSPRFRSSIGYSGLRRNFVSNFLKYMSKPVTEIVKYLLQLNLTAIVVQSKEIYFR